MLLWFMIPNEDFTDWNETMYEISFKRLQKNKEMYMGWRIHETNKGFFKKENIKKYMK